MVASVHQPILVHIYLLMVEEVEIVDLLVKVVVVLVLEEMVWLELWLVLLVEYHQPQLVLMALLVKVLVELYKLLHQIQELKLNLGVQEVELVVTTKLLGQHQHRLEGLHYLVELVVVEVVVLEQLT
jgi:hypothetical protein